MVPQGDGGSREVVIDSLEMSMTKTMAIVERSEDLKLSIMK